MLSKSNLFFSFIGGLFVLFLWNTFQEQKSMSESNSTSQNNQAVDTKGLNALVLGGSGAVGKSVIRDLLTSGAFKAVTSLGRREVPYDGPNKDTLVQKLVNFEKIEESRDEMKNQDVVFCSFGTTKAAAGSAEAFVKIDKDYVISTAKLIHEENLSQDSQGTSDVHFIYVSSANANKNSWFLYPKTKGEIEEELSKIGFKRLSILQPGILYTEGERETPRLFESIVQKISALTLEKTLGASVATVARAMRWTASHSPKVATPNEHGTVVEVLSNSEIHKLGMA
ncbi:hypothetical protein K493DRAFT_316021 [Basidiobolus meristosporus CBS 931.73]|uniref:NAD(P)-binding domain-containing protein n=1 Tax=Basidiobolus meristosporus CBS 931.73 TaxID=1314790 RepID=A0A1Y1Y660_9FUNG|nr:hypothetical protein K493DRAFT_316021 [Basidiobolus meristosporus CBS 931.73]|eukprot:ORX93449.1 hypothetical protein K493DRAFT_316021 [Basidiobolus meristosporus CBS 931.73]